LPSVGALAWHTGFKEKFFLSSAGVMELDKEFFLKKTISLPSVAFGKSKKEDGIGQQYQIFVK